MSIILIVPYFECNYFIKRKMVKNKLNQLFSEMISSSFPEGLCLILKSFHSDFCILWQFDQNSRKIFRMELKNLRSKRDLEVVIVDDFDFWWIICHVKLKCKIAIIIWAKNWGWSAHNWPDAAQIPPRPPSFFFLNHQSQSSLESSKSKKNPLVGIWSHLFIVKILRLLLFS